MIINVVKAKYVSGYFATGIVTSVLTLNIHTLYLSAVFNGLQCFFNSRMYMATQVNILATLFNTALHHIANSTRIHLQRIAKQIDLVVMLGEYGGISPDGSDR